MTLNPDQFGGREPGVYRGEPGEPNPDTYNRDQDWLHDHKRWVSSRTAGKPYVDTAVQDMKAQAKAKEAPVVAREKAVQKIGDQRGKEIVNGLKMVNKGLRGLGIKPKRRKRW